ncbi:protein sprouty homolog 3 [Rhineura floridana]|uniref:protein sprouty homolog 3 n=1 Tax=Rhineura floridana TaxID=261503 RepID=UPI002AC83A78|nr:protein sprouty homolog 3 [Rhineura floridana]XP_061454836.1 protein sprouty homolog 3 [Rhineura floridana]XP_061454837.1 protein sprouty homolog 3 [Rhineura floridana]
MPLSSSITERSPDGTMDSMPEDFQQVLSIDQIRAIRATNDYVERPASFKQAPSLPSPSQSQAGRKQEVALDQLMSSVFPDLHPSHLPLQQPLSHSSTASSISHSTTASEQRLLGGITPSRSGHSLVRAQPWAGDLEPKELLKGAGKKPPTLHAGHLFICEECGHCKCAHCAAARSLPSCWLCNQRCLCSPENLIDYGTCLCCVKGIFYHCSSDDEDTCADDPCSCGPGSCCARWVAMSFLSLLMPCLCCYFPTLGCLKLCQRGYDAMKRPGCRCQTHTNTVCRKISMSSGATFPKTLDKPV